MKEKLGLSQRKSGLRFGTPPHHPSPSLADISLEKDGRGYFQDYQHLSALGNLIAPRGPIVQRASRCKKRKTLTIFLIISVFIGRNSFSEWSWAKHHPPFPMPLIIF